MSKFNKHARQQIEKVVVDEKKESDSSNSDEKKPEIAGQSVNIVYDEKKDRSKITAYDEKASEGLKKTILFLRMWVYVMCDV